MESKTNTVSNFFYYLYFLLILLSNIFIPFSNIYSKYSLIIQDIILLFLFIINQKEIVKNKKSFFIVLFILVVSMISIAFTNGGSGSFANLFHFLVGILIFYNMKINNRMINYVYIICIILWGFNISLSGNAWNLYVSGNNEYNPNTIGINIFITTIIIKSFLKKYDRKKILSLILYCVSIYCIYVTNCRSATMAMIIYLLTSYMPIIRKFVLKHPKILMYIMIIVGSIFPLIFVNMYKNNVNIKLPFSSKKLYTGRETLWNYMLISLKKEKYGYLLGLGTNYYTRIGVINNFHNWYMGVLFTFGVPIFCLYYYFLVDIISKLKKPEILYGLYAIFLIGFTETIGLWSGTQVYIFMCIIVQRILEKDKNDNDNSIYTNV